jgi:hypothetical protein
MKTYVIEDENGNIIFIEDEEGKHWYNVLGRYHREYGPAIEHYSGRREWIVNGKHHRVDGPAIEWADGISNSNEWYYHGKYIRCSTQIEFDRIIRMKAFW